ncbi:MAG: RNA 3'-terminal phosphate cyclase [Nanopusillaceae archaeon]
MVEIDGSYGEGGGQILRTSLFLSIIFNQEIYIKNIRKNRNPPGLKNQHLHTILLLKKIINAETNEIKIGSEELYFKPGKINPGIYKENIGTAGSITLLLQGILLPLLFSKDKIKIKIIGGTDVKNSPSIDYFRYVLLPYYNIFGKTKLEVVRRGFYPKGNGEIKLEIYPKYHLEDYKDINSFLKDIGNIKEIDISEEYPEEIYIYSVASKDLKERNVAERMINSAIKLFYKYPEIKIKKNIEYVESLSTGAVITIVGKKGEYYFGSDSLGEKGKSSEIVGKEAEEKFIKVLENNVSVDLNLADNLVPFLLLLNGKYSTYEFTDHLKTNIYISNLFLNRIGYRIDRKIYIYSENFAI